MLIWGVCVHHCISRGGNCGFRERYVLRSPCTNPLLTACPTLPPALSPPTSQKPVSFLLLFLLPLSLPSLPPPIPIRQSEARMEKGAWKDLVAPGEYMWYRTMLGFGIQLLQQFSGINAVQKKSQRLPFPFLLLFDRGRVGGSRVALSSLVIDLAPSVRVGVCTNPLLVT